MAWDGSWVRMGERRTADKLFLKMICILYRPARPGASTAPGSVKKPGFSKKPGFWAGAAVVLCGLVFFLAVLLVGCGVIGG